MLKCWSLFDGALNVSQRIFFGESVEDLKFRIPIHSFLVQTEDHLILVDTGCGSYFGPSAGRLVKSLKAIGYTPGQITLILCTHLHPDHIGGLPLFPSATLCVSEREVKYWLDPKTEVSEYNKKYLSFVRECLTPHEERILLIKPECEIIPGVRALEAYGHTPGHTAFLFQSKNEGLLLWGDLVHKVDLQFSHPGKLVIIDDNPEAAAITRMHFLEMASDQKLLVGGAHLPGSGLCHISRSASGFNFF